MKNKRTEIPILDFDQSVETICDFISNIVVQAEADGVVVGLSGGVDSSLTAALCVKALGQDRVLGIFMPTSFTPQQDIEDAQLLANQLGIKTEYVNIERITAIFLEEITADQREEKKAIANLRARIRMVLLYYYANAKNYLVAGTGDKSELLIGFFTKYGDGGADFLPIGHLYKTQARELATYLGIPSKISYKPSSPQLYPGHQLLDELPLDYKDIDPILIGLCDQNLSPLNVSQLTNIPISIVEEILRRYKASKHKRSLPPIIREGE